MAAGAKGIRAGRAYVELFADDSKLVRGLRQAQRKLRAFGGSVRNIGAGLAGMGTAIVGPLLATAKVFTTVGDNLNKMSLRTGVSVESLSQLGFAAQQSGTDLATLENGVRNMQRSILDAERGLSTSVDSLKMLGLNVQQLKGLKPEDQFKLIADRIAQVPDESTQAALSMKLLGRAGTQLLPLMKNGAAGIEALQAEAERLGLTVGTDQAADAAKLGDAWGRVTSQLKAAAVQAGAALAPMLTSLASSVSKIVRKVIDFVQENQGLIVTAFKVGTAIVAAGAALIALGVGISTLGTILGGITSALTVIGSVLGFLISPIGLVIAAVTALGVVFTQTTDIGGQVVSFLVEKFNRLKDEVLAVFGGIRDAMMAGDMKLAAKILWLSLQVAWKQGIGFLEKTWIEFKRSFTSVAAEAVRAVMDIFNISVTDLVNTWSVLEKAWVEITSFLGSAWNTFTAGMMKGWNTAQNFVAKGIVQLMGLLDDSVDVDAAIADLDQQGTAKNRSIDADRDRKKGEQEQRRQERLAAIETGREQKRSALEGFLNDGQRNAVFDQQLADVNGELTAAQAELKAAIAEAAKKRAAKGDAKEGTAAETGKSGLPSFEGVGTGLGKSKASTLGTFNAAGVRGFSQGNAADRTAKATEETAKQTKKLVDKAKLSQLVFA